MKAVIYLRQSLDREGNELGVDRQLSECTKLCESRGWEVFDVVTDNNVSASRGVRPGFQLVLQYIQNGEADVIVVLKLDRLLRKLTELEDLIERGVQVVTASGDVDLTNAAGRLVGRILASVARGEMETKSERHKLANEQRASMGLPHGSRRPFGYEADLITIRKSEARVLLEMGQRIIGGHSYKEVAYWLNEQGHTTTTGKLFYPLTVRNMLRKKRYGGIREHNGTEYTAKWPAIFKPEMWERLQLTMKLRKDESLGGTQTGLPHARKYLLTGLVFCGKCGMPLNGATKRDHPDRPIRRTYHCRIQGDTMRDRGCGGVVRNADALEDYIQELVFERLDTPDLADLLVYDDQIDDGLRTLLEDRQTQRLRIDALVDDYATGLLTRQQLARAKQTAEAELERLESLIRDATKRRTAVAFIPAGQSVREAWEQSGSNNWRRSLLGLLIKRIDVQVGKTKPYYILHDGTRARFDPKLIDISWNA